MRKSPAESLEEGRVPQLLSYSGAAVSEHACLGPSHKQANAPPVVVEVPVTEAQQLGREVHG